MLVSELIERTLAEWLFTGGDETPQFDFMVGDITDTDMVIDLEGRTEYVPKDSVIQIDHELILTSETNGTAITVAARGVGGTEAVAHTAGTIVEVDPTFTRQEILNALRGVIAKLLPWGLYRRVVDEDQVFTTRSVIDMPVGTKNVHRILVRALSSEELWYPLSAKGDAWVEYTEFDPPKVQIRYGGAEGAEMRMVCMNDFTLPTDESDDLTASCGLPETVQEGLPMAVAGQVLLGREVPRAVVDRIRESLAAQGQEPGSIINVGSTLMSNFRRDDVAAERRRLNEIDEPAFEWQGARG